MDMPLWVLVIGAVMTVVGLALAGKRIVFLFRLISSGQPAPDRIKGVTGKLGRALKTQVVEVFGQKKLLKWSMPGAAHFFVFWAFVILGTVYLEAYGAMITRDPSWHFLVFGTWGPLGFAQDFIAIMALVGIAVFWWIRVREAPSKLGRQSRFSGSHLGGAYVVLFMIFNVVWTLFLYRGAVSAHEQAGHGEPGDGFGKAAFAVARARHRAARQPHADRHRAAAAHRHHAGVPRRRRELQAPPHLRGAAERAVLAPPGGARRRRAPHLAAASRSPSTTSRTWTRTPASASAASRTSRGRACSTWRPAPSAVAARASARPGTPRSRCRRRCSSSTCATTPSRAATTRSPTRPAARRCSTGNDTLTKEVERPLIGDESVYGVIDPDVLWSCVTCGACVNQCPVDIEHVDHIVDMRRYQVLVESNFPAELNQLFKGMENKGNPWNMSPNARLDWTKGLDVEVKVVGATTRSSRSTRSSGCSGSAAPVPTRTAPRRPPAPSPSCSTSPASPSACSAPARPAPVTPPAAPATSSCSRASRSRTSRRSRSTRSRRSSRPARTASTRSRTSTASSASSSTSSTTPSC